MARNASSYKPETPRPGTVEETNNRNIQNIFKILNKIQDQVDDLNETLNNLSKKVETSYANSKTYGLMMMDDD